MIKKVEVTSEKAFTYLRKHVRSSGKTLANNIEALSIETGKAYSFVPENTSEKELYNFESGVLYSYNENTLNNSIELADQSQLVPVQNDAEPIVIDSIVDYLRSNDNHCCLIEEALSQPNDPWVKKSQIKYSYLQNEMYYFFDQSVNQEEFRNSFRRAKGWYFLCTLSVLSPKEQLGFRPFQKIPVGLVNSYTAGVKSFFVSAYDNEGFLQWVG